MKQNIKKAERELSVMKRKNTWRQKTRQSQNKYGKKQQYDKNVGLRAKKKKMIIKKSKGTEFNNAEKKRI